MQPHEVFFIIHVVGLPGGPRRVTDQDVAVLTVGTPREMQIWINTACRDLHIETPIFLGSLYVAFGNYRENACGLASVAEREIGWGRVLMYT